jgi:hypothetical protein
MDPVRELPYWPAAVALLIEAGQMTASDYVPTHPDLLLASNGASTEVIGFDRHYSETSYIENYRPPKRLHRLGFV